MADLCTMTDYDACPGFLLPVDCGERADWVIAAGCANEHVSTELACGGCLAEYSMEMAGEEPLDCNACGQPVLITIREIAND